MLDKNKGNGFFDVALAIGNSYALDEMLSQSMIAYERGLGCTVVAIFRYSNVSKDYFSRNEVFSLHLDIVDEYSEQHPALFYSSKDISRLWKKSVVSSRDIDGRHVLLMSLPNFGFMLLSRSVSWQKDELSQLHLLNDKLATCALNCQISVDLTECLKKNENLSDLLPGIIFEIDLEGNLTYANKYALKTIVQGDAGKNSRRSMFEFVHPKDIQRAAESFKSVLHRDTIIPNEYTLINTSGDEFEGLCYSNKIIEKDQVVGVRGVVIDITERKKMEQKYKDKSEKYETLLLGSEAAIWDWNLATKEVYVNERWSAMMGYSLDEIEFTQHFWLRSIHPDDVHQYMLLHRQLLNGDIPFMQMEIRVKTKDNSYKWIRESARVVEQDAYSVPTRVVGTHIDITESKNAELSLVNSLRQQELISDIAILLNSIEDFDNKVNRTIQMVGEFIDVSRVYIFQNNPDGITVTNTYEWCNVGVKSEINSYQSVSYELFPSWIKIIEQNGMLVCNDSLMLPPDIYRLVVDSGTLSLVEYPLFVEGVLTGFIGFDECSEKREWTKWELELLRTVSSIIANALERKKILSELQTSYLTNQSIIDSLPDRMLHISKDGILINFNRAECGFCSNHDLQPGIHIRDFVPKKGVALIEKSIKKLKQGTILSKELRIEYNGDEMFFELCFSESAIATIILVVRNVTQRKKNEETIKHSETKFRELFEQMPIGITLTDFITRTYLECNAAFLEMLGYSADEIIGRSYWDITPEQYASTDDVIVAQIEKYGRYGPIEKEYIRKDGESVHVVIKGYLSYDRKGNPIVWTGVQDVSLLKKNEQELRRSEEKFRSYVENASDVILSTSLQGETLYVSPNIKRMLGYSQEEFQKRPLHFYVHPDDKATYFRQVKDFQIRGIPPDNMEYRIHNKNEEWRWVQEATSLNRDLSGNLYNISILRDFTKDKQAQQELEFLSLVASKSTNTIIITDKDKRISWVNDAFVLLTGYTFSEVVGKDPGLLLQGPDTSTRDIAEMRKGLESGKPFLVEILNYRKNGDSYWVEIYVTPIYDAKGDITSYIAVENNISNRKQNEKQIRLLTKGIENSPTMVVVTDSNGYIEYVNHRFTEITGYEPEEAIGQTPRLLKSGFQSVKFYEELWRTIKSGQNWKGELYNRKKDGSYYWELGTIAPILDADGDISHFIAIKEDITKSKELQQEMLITLDKAEKATRAKSDFLATMSHEIRTPMNGVIGMTSLLAKTPLTLEQRDYVSMIRSSGDALLSIINDILDFSKIESGRMVLETAPFDLRQCVEDVVDLFWIKASQRGIGLLYSVDPALKVSLVGDVGRLRQILVNLVGNAIKFTEKGEVQVLVSLLDVDKTNSSCRIGVAVKDSGIGIASDKIGQLFRPFMQVDTSITRRFGGTGLGLAITKQLVELMGGSISIESVEHQGSTFSFELTMGYVEHDVSIPVESLVNLRVFCDINNCAVFYALSNILESIEVRCTQVAVGASVIFTDKDPSIYHGGIPIIYLKEPGKNGITVDSCAAVLAMPIKASSVLNALLELSEKHRPKNAEKTEEKPQGLLADRFPISILVAEDNSINQKLMSKALAFYGYTADFAANGLEAVQAVDRQSYDLIFMDVQMPEMDGLEATRQIVAKPLDHHPVIVAMTASVLVGDREACISAGMNDFISKPIKIDVIEETIVRWFTPSLSK